MTSTWLMVESFSFNSFIFTYSNYLLSDAQIFFLRLVLYLADQTGQHETKWRKVFLLIPSSLAKQWQKWWHVAQPGCCISTKYYTCQLWIFETQFTSTYHPLQVLAQLYLCQWSLVTWHSSEPELSQLSVCWFCWASNVNIHVYELWNGTLL